MTQPLALIVDDEPDICELLEITLMRMGIDTRSALTLGDARELLTQNTFDLCLSDMRLPDGNGIELVQHINETYPQIPVAMITAHGNMESAVEALKTGAFDFVSKPVDLEVLRKLVEKALKLKRPDPAPAKESAGKITTASPLLGTSVVMDRIRHLIAKLARSQAPVYISGESGTGKELAARQIHAQGPRSGQNFVAVNCGAIPRELMESELFGHVKGSFTGATTDHEGLFQVADGGTLFLDEVADLPLSMQVKLLRAIQEKRVRPVGGHRETAVDIRIISATHKDLAERVKQGEFRQDLFYRINVIELTIPPLRERSGDIPLLADKILERLGGKGIKPKLLDSALDRLKAYPFPGNVRELENILERATTLCENNALTANDLLLPETPLDHKNVKSDQPLGDMLGDIERQAIIKALEETRWNRTAAAKRLGMSLRSLRYRLEKLGID
ncbi:MAG: sigma-54-dependent Fis family transcriptional regulator [gamma proteobacterium endosymbiont of Lamellibrachia anaximandri]|nr:sigma-54-dependent Fis family transcriptional regulator [gamma proteobacterium endosymbiont of Lamellibrachia anaximandri]